MGTALTFTSEEEKIKAIQEYDERSSEEGLDEIMNAPVEEPKQDDTPEDLPPSELDKLEKRPEESADLDPEQKPEDNNKSEGDDPNKKIEDLEAKLAERERFINENLSKMDEINILQRRVKELEEGRKEEPVEKEEFVLKESKLKTLQEKRVELLKKYPNPEDQLDGEFVAQMNEIQEGMFEEMNTINHNMSLIQDKAAKANEKAESYVNLRKKEEEQKKAKTVEEYEKEQIVEFSKKNPQFKLSKSFDEVDEDYKQYQKSVTKIYFGRDPKSKTEINEAMNALKRRSPSLIGRLSVSGVSPDLTDDMKKYLGLCEVWDGYTGYINPETGEYNRDANGNIVQITRYDPETGKQVPDKFNSPEAYFNNKFVKHGQYARALRGAKIAGAKEALQAASQRDTGAVELGSTETSGGTPAQVKEEALKRVNNIDVELAVRMARRGDPALLNEYNKLAESIDWPTYNIEEE
jgi:hypothetical protein